jgi:hypothetical protein
MHVCSHSTVLLKERRVKMKGHGYQNLILHSPPVCVKILWPRPSSRPCTSVNRMWLSQSKDWNGNLIWKCRRKDYSGNLQTTDDWCDIDIASYGNCEQAELLATSDYTCFINCIESAIPWVPLNSICNARSLIINTDILMKKGNMNAYHWL